MKVSKILKSNGFVSIVLAILTGMVYQIYVPSLEPFYHGDHAVPYQMTVTSWSLNDLFYWGASRFGAVYMIFWKGLGRHIFGGSAHAFFYGHKILVLTGLFFWLILFRTVIAKLVFILLVMPAIFAQVDEWLLPGQPYGMLLLLNGIAFNILNRTDALSRGRIFSMIVIFFFLFWMHILSAAMFLLLCLVKLKQEWDSGRFGWVNVREAALRLGPVVFVCGALFLVAKKKAWDLGGPGALKFGTFGEVAASLKDFASKGLSNHYGPYYGIILIALAIFSLYADRLRKPSVIRNLNLVYIVPISAVFTFYILIHNHYIANLRSERYLLFLLPPLVFYILTVFEDLGQRRLMLSAIFATGFACMIVLPRFTDYPGVKRGIFDSVTYSTMQSHAVEVRQKYENLFAQGCKKLVGKYWDVYPATPHTNGRMLSAAWDYPRNRWMLEKMLLDLPGTCIQGSEIDAIRKTGKPLNACRVVGAGFELCG